MISTAETIMAHIALENVLAQLSDEQERESLTAAVSNTIAGKPVIAISDEGEPNKAGALNARSPLHAGTKTDI